MKQEKPVTNKIVPRSLEGGYVPPKTPLAPLKDIKKGFAPPKPPKPKK
jgi:hypothetical protein